MVFIRGDLKMDSTKFVNYMFNEEGKDINLLMGLKFTRLRFWVESSIGRV
jgi:hypothetical protein